MATGDCTTGETAAQQDSPHGSMDAGDSRQRKELIYTGDTMVEDGMLRQQVDRAATIYLLRALTELPQLADHWSQNESVMKQAFPLLSEWLAEKWRVRLHQGAQTRGGEFAKSLLCDDTTVTAYEWRILLGTPSGQKELRIALGVLEEEDAQLRQYMPRVFKQLQVHVQLSDADMQLLHYLAAVEWAENFKNMLESVYSDFFARVRPAQFLACVLAVPLKQAIRWLEDDRHPLVSCGLMMQGVGDYANNLADLLYMSQIGRRIFHGEVSSVDDLLNHLVRPALPSTLNRLDFPHMSEQLGLVLPTLAHAMAVAQDRVEPGFHVLFYGEPGTGKTELARLLPELLRLRRVRRGMPPIKPQFYEVPTSKANGAPLSGSDRFDAFLLAQSLLSHTPGAVLVFDEMEDALPDLHGDQRQRSGNLKGFMNHILETSPVPTVWISNRVAHIDLSFLRRFSVPVEVPVPPTAVRLQMVRRCAARYQLRLSEAVCRRLANDGSLKPAMLADSTRLVARLPVHLQERNFLLLLENKKQLLDDPPLPPGDLQCPSVDLSDLKAPAMEIHRKRRVRTTVPASTLLEIGAPEVLETDQASQPALPAATDGSENSTDLQALWGSGMDRQQPHPGDAISSDES